MHITYVYALRTRTRPGRDRNCKVNDQMYARSTDRGVKREDVAQKEAAVRWPVAGRAPQWTAINKLLLRMQGIEHP